MKREDLLKYLKDQDLKFSFSYEPHGVSSLNFSNEYFKEFLLEKMFEYVVRPGDPISGDFIASRKNEDIITTSEGRQEVIWNEAMYDVEDFFNLDVNRIERLLYNTFTNKIDDN